MSYEEEFDKIVRQKAEEAEYSFEADNWAKVRETMDAERTVAAKLAQKKLYVPIASVLGVLAIGIATYLFISPSNSEQVLVSQKSAAPSLDQQKQINQPVTTENNIVSKQDLPTLTPEGQKENTYQTESDKNITNRAEAAIVPASSVSKRLQGNLKSEIANTGSQKVVTASGAIKLQDVPVTQDNSSSASAANNTQAQAAGGNEPPQGQIAATGMAAAALIALTPQQKETANNQEASNAGSTAEVSTNVESIQKYEILTSEELPMRSGYLPVDQTEESISAVPLVLLDRYNDDYYTKRLRTYNLNAELGGNYLVGWNTSNGTDGAGINWFAGLNYSYFVSEKMSLGGGIQTYNTSHIEDPFYHVSQKEYGFGSTTTHTLVTATDLYYVSLPLRFSYLLTDKHQVGLGFNAGYLVQSKNSMTTYHMAEGEISNSVSTTSKGVYDGISRSNYLASMFYTAHFTNKFAVNTEFTYGLTDIFKNFGDINNHESSMGIRVSLQYTLLQK